MKFATAISSLFLPIIVIGISFAEENEQIPERIQKVVAVENVCAWPNLTLMRDGSIVAIFHNQPSHGQQEGDIECWASKDGLKWEKRSKVTSHDPDTVRMNHAAGLTAEGDLIVLCSGWTNQKHPDRPKQAAFRDDILRSWILRSSDGGVTWKKETSFPEGGEGWSELIPFGDIWSDDKGALHVSCYQGEFTDPTKSTKTKSWRSWHLRSTDGGSSWEKLSLIGPTHNETTILPLGHEKWLAAARISHIAQARTAPRDAPNRRPRGGFPDRGG